jgi:hypothetical protein
MPSGASPSGFVQAPAFAPPRLARDVARRLDRLARQAHAFHRFAHHPLCERYAGELIALGRRDRVCRGCAAVLAGMLSGAGLALVFAPGGAVLYALLGAGTALGVASFWVRLPKLVGRFVPAAALGSAFASVFNDFGSYAWLVASVAFAAAFFAYRLRGPSRSPCASCPERLMPAPCSGFVRIVRRERAFQRVARRIIDRA